jgi:nitrogen fixation protein NifU and related proteins
MADLTELYQQVILDHNRKPRNFRVIEDADRVSFGDNPLCGDKIKVYLRLNGNVIEDVSFHGSGCAISQSSASLMTQSVLGKTVEEAIDLFTRFHTMVTTEIGSAIDETGLGKLRAFGGVREFPSRVKCANLSWHTLRAALESGTDPVSTE